MINLTTLNECLESRDTSRKIYKITQKERFCWSI